MKPKELNPQEQAIYVYKDMIDCDIIKYCIDYYSDYGNIKLVRYWCEVRRIYANLISTNKTT